MTRHATRRDGTVLPLVTMCLVVLMAFLALAIDVGVMAIARNQCQNAADAAAMAGARALDGSADNNKTDAEAAARAAAEANEVLAQSVQSANVEVKTGKYYYDRTLATPKFVSWYEGSGTGTNVTAEPYTLMYAKVEYTNGRTFFSKVVGVEQVGGEPIAGGGGGGPSHAKIVGLDTFRTGATAVAAHRPRDVVMVMDMSGSMRLGSLVGAGLFNGRDRSMNADPDYPKFGHYSDTTNAKLTYANSWTAGDGEVAKQSNITTETTNGPPLVKDFYKDNGPFGATQEAFTAASAGYSATPGGDNFLKSNRNGGTNYAATVKDVVNATTYDAVWQTLGYDGTNLVPKPTLFAGYTQGPGYWGKTFFVWPPDPRDPTDDASGNPLVHGDWRKRFFRNAANTGPLDDNTKLFDANGLANPSTSTVNNYRINYKAILKWIKRTPNPFPERLRAGGILYYDAIPDDIDVTSTDAANTNQRFWRQYIDEMLGFRMTGVTSGRPTYSVNFPNGYPIRTNVGCGDWYNWGTYKISAKPVAPDLRYMDYEDNPKRPRTHMWFGPLTMVDFLGNYNGDRFWWPGTCHEAQSFHCKLGMQAAIKDIESNHPNDNVATVYFSTPKRTYNGAGYYNRAIAPLGRDYKRMKDGLWFAPNTIDTKAEMRPFDAAIKDVPLSHGGTCYAMPLMLAYNQFSSNTTLQNYADAPSPAGEAGGYGRRGAQRLVIFETDGAVNTSAQAGVTNSGAGKSYYNVLIKNNTDGGGQYPTDGGGSVSRGDAISAVTQLCALETASPPGYSTARKPVLVHCIGFGSLFEETASTGRANALSVLQEMQFIGGKAGGEQETATTALKDYKIITGTYTDRIDKMQKAFSAIMQDGVQVTLIR